MAKKKRERRRHVRKEVLDTFQVFVSIPQLGPQKIYLKDISRGGLAFAADRKGKFEVGEEFNIYFFVNPSLRLPLSIEVMNFSSVGSGRNAYTRVGCRFTNAAKSPALKAFCQFVDLLDDLKKYLD